MESPGSELSMDSTDSSPADSTSADSPPAQAISSMSEDRNPPTMDSTTIIDNDDSASDISMSTDSDDEEEEEQDNAPSQAIQVSTAPASTVLESPEVPEETSKKRKFSISEDTANGLHNIPRLEVHKRLRADGAIQRHRMADNRLRKDRSLLPPEIWHHIFTFCPPRVLGILLQVNKSFNAYLDPSSAGPSLEPLSVSITQILTPASIWRASRSLYNLPSMPSPLLGMSELDMWKLACGSTCQSCDKKRQPNYSTPIDQWHLGPGEKSVIPIWSFGTRYCGLCLQKESMKEIDLLLSSSIPSPLLTALPFVFFTNELNVISPSTIESGQPPAGVLVAKHFSKSQIEAIKLKFEEVKALGLATAEEWLKGLDGQGQEKKSDAARWERWEAQGGLTRMRNLEAIEAASRLLRTASARTAAASSTTNGNFSVYQSNGSLPKPPHLPNNSTQHLPMAVHSIIASSGPPRFGSPIQNGFASYTSRQPQLPKHERTKEEVAELKLARKAEIERRCMLLNSPITPAVLAHMPSFQAAIQIIQPVTDSAWEVLEPRLLSQREEAEQREKDRLAQTRVVQEQERRVLDSQARSDSKDPLDREWDDFQAPLRARIGGYADEIIRDGWNGGEKVSYETSPHFAADVLIYVRKRFYAEIAKDEAAIRATGREPEADPPNGPYTRRLILENMKWVFDTKVKPYTEQYRKELFLCNACDYASKYYGFEGVIQHFAAKHTSALSSGSVVVHWKSEWPEYPPFNPDPSSSSMKPYYPAVPSVSVPYSSAPPAMQPSYGYGGYQPAPVSAPTQVHPVQSYQDNSGSYYNNTQYGDQYSAPQNGSYAPSPVYQEPSTGYQASQYSVPHPQTNGYNDAPQGYPQQTYSGQYTSGSQGMYASPQIAPLYPTTAPDVTAQQVPYVPPPSEYGSSYNPPTTYPPANYNQPPQRTEEYTARLQDLVKNARNIWSSIGSLKEVPGSLKVYTIIFHILQRFRSTFQEDPSLSILVDGLSNNKDMRPVRNVNGLVCKACSLGMIGSVPTAQKKHFSFPQLVNHFHSVHEQGVPHDTLGHIPDWTKDMVDLPDISKLSSVVNAPGMDDQKLRLFTDALPEIIPVPEPRMEEPQNGFNGHYEDRAGPASYTELAPSQDNHEKYYATADRGRPTEPDSVPEDTGEYDPRNPGNMSFDQQPIYKAPRSSRPSGEFTRDHEPVQRYRRYEDEPRREVYQSHSDRQYVERRPSSSYGIPVAEYERVLIREEAPIYLDRQPRYHDSGEVEYRVRREPPIMRYDEVEMAPPGREYRVANTQAFQSNRDDIPLADGRASHTRPGEDAASQQSRIIDVVAQISQHAQQARERQPVREEPLETGSEDGEVRVENGTRPAEARPTPTDEATNDAERFLNNFRPGESNEGTPKIIPEPERRRDDEPRPAWEADRNGSSRAYQAPLEPQRRGQEYDEEERYVPGRRLVNPAAEDEYGIHERAPLSRPSRTYAYDDRYVSSVPEQVRDRSPELVDRRYKLNNVVYRDERQGSSNGTHRTPSRYARYESVRLENDRARSRSPVYVKMGPQPGQYRERSQGAAPPLRQEPIYRARTPQQQQAGEEIAYERPPPPRQEYYRVYADEREPRPRAPQYAAAEPAYEYVRVQDPQGDYMIRRPVRREPEPVYYEDEVYARQPVYESRPARAEPQYEEYDPRQPAPGPGPAPAPVRQARYQ
ncbi:uncharacterized protein LY89DRAFT_321228 [Mollisia scopiformis]|uniref:DUF7892 domain-containing protein n=1 Tax=Mollisia scopiformis TaxID=149040 RepID=A0A132BA96_MOLSC|nr:uncharacterized protein LY89DRAFT_321228 [Mollisia scopiformis]KUJ09173.1 hypothetical protein LY89DRAFT_321228 [Mollisia scopiformis]